MSAPIFPCDPQNPPGRDPLLQSLLGVLFNAQRNAPNDAFLTADQVSSLVGPTYSLARVRSGLARGAAQGLFLRGCDPIINPGDSSVAPRYAFNPNAPTQNPLNWPYMCPGASIAPSANLCTYKPCRSKRGSFQTDVCCAPQPFGSAQVQSGMETLNVPGVGTITRVRPIGAGCIGSL